MREKLGKSEVIPGSKDGNPEIGMVGNQTDLETRIHELKAELKESETLRARNSESLKKRLAKTRKENVSLLQIMQKSRISKGSELVQYKTFMESKFSLIEAKIEKNSKNQEGRIDVMIQKFADLMETKSLLSKRNHSQFSKSSREDSSAVGTSKYSHFNPVELRIDPFKQLKRTDYLK